MAALKPPLSLSIATVGGTAAAHPSVAADIAYQIPNAKPQAKVPAAGIGASISILPLPVLRSSVFKTVGKIPVIRIPRLHNGRPFGMFPCGYRIPQPAVGQSAVIIPARIFFRHAVQHISCFFIISVPYIIPGRPQMAVFFITGAASSEIHKAPKTSKDSETSKTSEAPKAASITIAIP